MVEQARNGLGKKVLPNKDYWNRCLRRVDWGGAFPIVPVTFDQAGKPQPKAKVAREVLYPNWTSYHYLRWLDKDVDFEGYLFGIGAAPLVVLDVDERPEMPSRLESLRRLFELAGDNSFDSLPYVSTFRGGRHYYFRVPESIWMAVIADPESYHRIDLAKERHLGFDDSAVLEGVEVFVSKPILGMGTIRLGKQYRPYNFEAIRSILDVPELPAWLLYILSGGLHGYVVPDFVGRLSALDDKILNIHLAKITGKTDVRIFPQRPSSVSSDARDELDAKLVYAGILRNPDVSLWESYLQWVTGLAYPGSSSISLIKVLPTAPGCRRTWQIACPFHDDRNPSSTVSINGKFLVRCHACSSVDPSQSNQNRVYYSHIALLYVYMFLTNRINQGLFVRMMYDVDSRARQSLRWHDRDVLAWRMPSNVWQHESVRQALDVYVSSSFGQRIYNHVPPVYGRLMDMPKIYETPSNVDRSSTERVMAKESALKSSVSSGAVVVNRPKRKLSAPPKEVYKRYQRRYNDRGLHVIGEMVKLGNHVCIVGRPGSYKSTLLRSIATTIASGGSLFGRPCPKRNVLYVNFDDSPGKLSSALSRLEDMMPEGSKKIELLDMKDKEVLDAILEDYGGDHIAAIADAAEMMDADVIILDGLNHLLISWANLFAPRRGGDAALNDYGVITQAMADIHRRLIGASRVLFSTMHMPKGAPPVRDSADILVDMGHGPAGSIAIHGGVDVLWVVDVKDGGERVQVVKQTKNREAGYISYYLKYDEKMLNIVREEMIFDYAKRRIGNQVVDEESETVSSVSDAEKASDDFSPPPVVQLPSTAQTVEESGSASSLVDDGSSVDLHTLDHSQSAHAPEGKVGSDSGFFKPHLICRLDKISPTKKYRLDVDCSMGDDSVIVFDPKACPDPSRSYYMSVRPYRRGESYDDGLDASFSFYGYSLLHVLSGVRAFQGQTPKDVSQLIFDIEASNINPQHGRVLAIGYKYVCGDQVISDVLVGDEVDILRRFFDLTADLNPKWLVGYNIFDFDLPYLLARAGHYGLEWSWLKDNWYKRFTSFRAGTQQHDVDIYYPKSSYGFEERAVIDLYLLAHRYLMGLESYGLASVYSHITGKEVEKLGEKSVMEHWDPELVKKQVSRDVEMTYEVLHNLIVIPFALVEYVPALFCDILYGGNGSLWSRILTMDYIRRGLPILVGEGREIDSYEGAISVCRRTGIFGKTAKLDVVSLYPNIIVQHNICSDRDYAQLMPSWVKRLLDERVKLKQLAKETGDPMLDARQNALKVIINSAYGFLGTSGLYWSYGPAAAAVTKHGREVLRRLEEMVSVHHVPIELDTDGILFAVSENGMDPELLRKEIEEAIGYKLDLEFYDACVSVSAKNYALLAGDKVVIKGASLKNRSQSKYIMSVVRRVLLKLLESARSGNFDLKEVMELIEKESASIMDPNVVPDELLVEKVVATRRTSDRKDVEWDLNDGERVLSGKVYYIYYAKGMRKRVISVGMPAERGLELDRMRYVKKLYDSLGRLMKLSDFAKAFNDYFGGEKSFFARFAQGQVVMDI
jgi:DNA polymerase elongation subunit (family B)